MSKHISLGDDEDDSERLINPAHHSHPHHPHAHHHHPQDEEEDDLPSFPSDSSSSPSLPSDKEEKSFEQLMMSPLGYLPPFINPAHHHIGDNSHVPMIPSPDDHHNSLLHPMLGTNDPYFLQRQDVVRGFTKEGLRAVDEAAGGAASEKIVHTLQVNLFQAAFGVSNISNSLSRPSFFSAPDGKVRFVCGTEEQDEDKLGENKLIFGHLTHNNTKLKVDFTHPIVDHVRDLQWLDSKHIVFAIGSKLGIVRLTNDYTMDELTLFPEFHTDTIREIAISQPQANLVLSGGFDGKVFVTDISKLYVDIRERRPKSENSLYPCAQVVGSVRWHPEDEFLASCTTDFGILHIFDVRTDRKRAATVCDTMKKELFTHDYRDAYTLFLGFGDGEIQVFDVRTNKSYPTFHDPFMRTIGELRFNRPSKHFAVFGIPEFTLWQYNENEMTLLSHQQLGRHSDGGFYKTTGSFFSPANSNTTSIAVTDSFGNFSIYGLA